MPTRTPLLLIRDSSYSPNLFGLQLLGVTQDCNSSVWVTKDQREAGVATRDPRPGAIRSDPDVSKDAGAISVQED